MNHGTIIFLVKRNEKKKISEICLAMKKRSYGKGKWNGSGGKVGDNGAETIRASAVREVKEELDLDISEASLNLVGQTEFIDKANNNFSQMINIFVVNEWNGEPTESEEMKPQWFGVEEIPYDDMWEDDKYWLPMLLREELFEGKSFFKGYDMVSSDFEKVGSLTEFEGEFEW